MAHFYANIQGNRGEATRMGTKSSGISGHIRGWDIGCKTHCSFNTKTKQDEVSIHVTTGSNGHGFSLFLGRFSLKDGHVQEISS